MNRIAYSGIEGAFAHIVARRIFPDDEAVPFENFRSAYEAVRRGDCDYAVLPIDNSYSGEVTDVMDLLFEGSLYINALYSLPVTQSLLGVEGSTPDTVRTVISHTKALEQCDEYIRRKGYRMSITTNTARAARDVAELKDVTVAAIANIETAEIYGLKVLEPKINERDDNTTRFVVMSASPGRLGPFEKAESFIMIFTLENRPGSLLGPLQVIAAHGFNMKVIHSRPLKKHQWQYYFYVEAEGDHNTPEGRKMLKELKETCAMIKILGPGKTV